VTFSKVLRRCGWWAVFAVGAAGCGVLSAKPDPTRFYLLAPITDATPAGATGLVIGLGPIVLPPYLQRPELATRVGPNEVRFREFDRWAGSLPSQVASVLGEDLRLSLGTDRIVPFPWYSGTALDVVVEIQVFRFELDRDGQVHLSAHWRLKDPAHSTDLKAADADLREPVGTGGADATVAALSRVLGQLAHEIAEAVVATRPSGRR
jgi:uncharacterized protein